MKKGYFDNAATTLVKPDGMYQYVADYMMKNGANIGRSNIATAKSAGALVKETRELILDLAHAPKTKEVVFLPSATIALNTIINGINLNKSSCVYVSRFEHNAVMRTLLHLQKEKGFGIEYLAMKDESSLEYDLAGIKQQFESKKPELLIISHVSNVIGLIAPVDSIATLVKTYGATILVDGAQAFGNVDVVVDNKIDYYVFAGHKTLMAPFGVAGFICNKNTTLPAFIYGGTGVDSANIEMPETIPERFEAGSQNIMAIAGLNYSLKWINKNKQFIKQKEKDNLIRLSALLKRYGFIRSIEVTGESVSIIACTFDGLTSDEVGRVLGEKGVTVRTGLHCAPTAHKFLGSFPSGLVRFSVSCFTSEEDFEALEEALDYIDEEI